MAPLFVLTRQFLQFNDNNTKCLEIKKNKLSPTQTSSQKGPMLQQTANKFPDATLSDGLSRMQYGI